MGAALGKAGLARRTTLGMSTLVIANNLPDLDVAVFATNTLAMSFRRGWTHGVLAQAVLPLALPARCSRTTVSSSTQSAAVAGRPSRKARRAVLLLAYIGVLAARLHGLSQQLRRAAADAVSERWFYGDALYIVDPWLYLALGLGWWLASRRRSAAPLTRRNRPESAWPRARLHGGDARLERAGACRSARRPGARGPSGRPRASW